MQGVPEEAESNEDEIPVWDEGDGAPHYWRSTESRTEGRPEETTEENTLAVHHIFTGDNPAIRLPPYELPFAYKEMVSWEIMELLENLIIEPSMSEWALPVVLFMKDNTIRLC